MYQEVLAHCTIIGPLYMLYERPFSECEGFFFMLDYDKARKGLPKNQVLHRTTGARDAFSHLRYSMLPQANVSP